MRVGVKNVYRSVITFVTLLSISFGFIFSIPTVSAAPGINQQLNFQGRLLNAQGAVVPDGYYNIQFKLYQDGTGQAVGNPGGSLLWTENHINADSNGVRVKNGFISVQLGSVTPFGSSVDWNQDTIWLSMNIGSTAGSCTPFSNCSPDGEMVPMKRLSATPYSLNSARLGGLNSAQFLQLAQGVQTDASSIPSVQINKTGSGGFLNLQASGESVFTLTGSGDILFGANADHVIAIEQAAATDAGNSLSLVAGDAGTTSNLDGGDLLLQGGAGNGTGTSGSVIVRSNLTNATNAFQIQNATGDSLLIANTIDSRIGIGTETPQYTLDVAGGTGIVGQFSGRVIGGSAVNNDEFTNLGQVTALITGAAIDDYVQLQPSSPGVQQTGNLNLSGTAILGSGVLAPSFDSASAGNLHIGATNATDIFIGGGSTNIAIGDSRLTVQNATGRGASSTVVIEGDNASAGNAAFFVDGGENTFEAGGTSAYSSRITSSAANVGLIVQGAVSQSADLIQLQNSSDTNLFRVGANGATSFRSGTDSATAFQIQNAADISLFTVDTANNRVYVGNPTADSTGAVFVFDSKTTAGDPTGVQGSMYFNSDSGNFRCYDGTEWRDCGASPDSIITISPEYNNAVMHGTGVGTMTADLCSDTLNVNDGSSSQPSICGTNETYNFYKWTSPQASAQTYSIYVTYQLPSTFEGFEPGETSIIGRTDSSSSVVNYQVYRNDFGSGMTACGGTVAVSSGAVSAWQTGVASGGADPSACGFDAGDSIVFKINMIASQNASAYVSNLNFTFSNR